jgi:hypothetical protein
VWLLLQWDYSKCVDCNQMLQELVYGKEIFNILHQKRVDKLIIYSLQLDGIMKREIELEAFLKVDNTMVYLYSEEAAKLGLNILKMNGLA